jgi:hypothetical protein
VEKKSEMDFVDEHRGILSFRLGTDKENREQPENLLVHGLLHSSAMDMPQN